LWRSGAAFHFAPSRLKRLTSRTTSRSSNEKYDEVLLPSFLVSHSLPSQILQFLTLAQFTKLDLQVKVNMLRLMNIKTHQLDTFDNWDKVPPYAILSHTWEEGEVIFHDISGDSADVGKKKQGWNKILGACKEAEKFGIFYLWVDTCCIFKESSAELSESINSMFAWYRDARICTSNSTPKLLLLNRVLRSQFMSQELVCLALKTYLAPLGPLAFRKTTY
jgi:hypothetical protein